MKELQKVSLHKLFTNQKHFMKTMLNLLQN